MKRPKNLRFLIILGVLQVVSALGGIASLRFAIVFSASLFVFLCWLVWDNVQARRDVAEHMERLAARKAAFRAKRDEQLATRSVTPNER